MWVTVFTVVLLAVVAVDEVIGDTNTGQPWPANAAGYNNFSQINPAGSTKLETDQDAPLLQSAPIPSSTNLINLDMSNPNTNLVEALEKVLAPELANRKITDEQQKISTSINITPPPNANMSFVQALQVGARVAIKKFIPSAGSALRIAITKSSSGAIVNVKVSLDVIIPAAITPTLPPSTVPEIDLTAGSSGLPKNLQIILQKELIQAGYNVDSKAVQNFSLSFSVLPPQGATKDYVRLNVLGPLLAVLKRIVPTAALTSVSVNTQESNQQILRQTVTFHIQIVPPYEFEINENVVEVPQINLNTAGSNVVSTVITTLQDQVRKNVAVNRAQAKTLSIPFKITPPAGATQQQIQDLYITPLSQVLSKLDPTGKILKISQKTLPNGDIIIFIYMNIPANQTTNPSSNGQIQPVVVPIVPPSTATSKQIPITTTEKSNPVNINNRNSFPEEEDEIPPETTDNEDTSDDVVPNNAIKTSVVDLTTPTASINNVQQVLNEELSPLSNPTDDAQPKVLAIPFRMIPPAGASLEQIKENVVLPIGKLLTTLEPTGNVITSKTTPLPNGEVESIIYFNIPSVKDSKTFKVISDEQRTTTVVPEISIGTESTVTPGIAKEPVISPVTKAPQTQVPIIKPENTRVIPETTPTETQNEVAPKNAIITSPIDLAQINPANLPADIDQRVNEVRKKSNGQPQIIGLPFVLPGNQKPSFILTQGLKIALKSYLPSGNILQTSEPKTLPNGKTEIIIYGEFPAVTTVKPSEKVAEEQTEPSVIINISTAIPETTPRQTQNEVAPKNAILTTPIDLKQGNPADLPADIKQRINDLNKNSNGQPQTIGIPFVFPGNQKPSFFLTHGLEILLKHFVPSGTIVQKSEPKTLPNGDTEIIFYAELPAVTTVKPSEKAAEEQTEPSAVPNVSTVIPETTPTETQNEVAPKNAIITTPIDLKQANPADIPADIEQRINDINKNSNGQPQTIGIPFVFPGNQKLSLFLTHGLEIVLKNFVPSGTIVQKSEPKTLPNGDTEIIIYVELPAVTTVKPIKKVAAEQTEPSVVINISKVTPKTTPTETQNEVAPENAIITSPVDLKQINTPNLPADIAQIVNEVRKTSNGQSQVVGVPFVLPKNQKPSTFLIESLKTVLKAFVPSGTIVQVSKPKTLPSGETQFIIYDEFPASTKLNPNGRSVEKEQKKPVAKVNLEPIVFPTETTEVPNVVSATEIVQTNDEKVPTAAVEDVNLDEPGATVEGEVGKALVKAVTTISSTPTDLNKPANLKFNIYAPLDNSLPENKKLINDVSSELQIIEPNAKVVTAKTNENPQRNEPNGVVEFVIPSIVSSETAQNINNALKISTIDINIPELQLVENIKDLLQNGLKSSGQLNPKGSQLFDLNFRLNPYDTKGSVAEVLKALKAVDPKGKIVSYKIRSGPDGLDYLDVIYLIPRLEYSIIYKNIKPKRPKIVYESLVDIDTRNPLNGILENIIKEVEAAENEVQGAQKRQLVDLPLDFKFTNSRGLSDSKVSTVISQTLPTIKGYISQILPEGNIISIDTVSLPNSDDVLLKIVVRTPYEPNNKIVIEEVRPQVRTTTPRPRPGGLFGLLGF